MKKLWIAVVTGLWGIAGAAWPQIQEASYSPPALPAQISNDTPAALESFSKPSGLFFLQDPNLLLSASIEMEVPDPPKLGSNGNLLEAVNDASVPERNILENLAAALAQSDGSPSEGGNQFRQYHWRTTSSAWSYCYYRDYEGNDWYGWGEGEKFNWVLCWSGYFWWKDRDAARWLCFDKGDWWWPEPRDSIRVWVRRDGSYYLCDTNGAVVDNKGERPGELRSGWKRQFQGDQAQGSAMVDDCPDHDGDHPPCPTESCKEACKARQAAGPAIGPLAVHAAPAGIQH